MIELIKNYKIISIIGLAKNVGKTTTLNYLLSKQYHKKRIGLTSIGRDGEERDIVTNTFKPKIYIEKGTIVATTTLCLKESDFTKMILETTNIITPLGEVVVVKALSDGFVDLAGPSHNNQIRKVIKIFEKYNVELILIDGAISRKGLADTFVSEASILCTGAAYSHNIDKVVKDTLHFVNILTLKEIDAVYKKRFNKLIREVNISVIDKDNRVKKLEVQTALKQADAIVKEINYNSRYLLLKGALSKQLVKRLIEYHDSYNDLTVVIVNGTKCLVEPNDIYLLNKCGVKIEVLNSINLLFVTFNPKSIYGYEFKEEDFKEKLQDAINIPVFNVMKEVT